ncbi:MAG: hypothetical protein SV375_09405 [Thermodesulfobacteriota bacterium]|nr:hypothetical protein [Thermodesulfobacteriota bacterium]
MKTKQRHKQLMEGEKKMKNMGNIFRIMVLMTAGVLLFGAGGYAAAKPGKKPLTVKVRKVNKVKRVTQKDFPLRASGPSDHTPKHVNNQGDAKWITKPDNPHERGCFVEAIRQTDPTKFKGHFKTRLLSVQNAGQPEGMPEGIAPEPELVPQPELDPVFGAFQQFEKIEIFSASDRIDPSHLPGPERRPPCGRTDPDAWDQWWEANNSSDSANRSNYWRGGSYEGKTHPSESTHRPTREKYESMNENENTNGDQGWEDYLEGLNEACEEDNSDNGDNSGHSVQETDYDFAGDDESVPEGGDEPDEFRTPTSEMAKRHLAEALSGGSGSNDEGEDGSTPQRTQQGGGLPNDPRKNPGQPLPEDGQPDEMTTPTASGALNSTVNLGQTYQPEPGGEDPDDPRASEGRMSAAGTTLGYAASPSDGGQGGTPVPTDPRF